MIANLQNNNLSPVNTVKLDDVDLLLPPTKIPFTDENLTPEQLSKNLSVTKNNYNLFCKAIRIAFDIQPGTLMNVMINLDLLWRPEGEDTAINFYQWIGQNESSKERDPMMSTFSFLFENKDPYDDEPYLLDEGDRKLRREFWTHIKASYKNAKEYVHRVNEFFYLDSFDNDYWIPIIQRKVWGKGR